MTLRDAPTAAWLLIQIAVAFVLARAVPLLAGIGAGFALFMWTVGLPDQRAIDRAQNDSIMKICREINDLPNSHCIVKRSP